MRALCLAFGLLLSTSAAAQPQLLPLGTWFSQTRTDHYSSSNPARGSTIGRRNTDGGGSGYELVRIEGRVFNPDRPQPPGTVPLYSFWHPGRRDNFQTTDPRWTGSETRDGYRRFRLEGYVFDRPRLGTIPLVSLWNPSTTDNATTTDPRVPLALRGAPDGALPSLSGYRVYRIEGYVYPPEADASETSRAHVANLGRIGYGAWRPLMPSENGTRPTDILARARPRFTAPLLVAPIAFADMGFDRNDLLRYAQFSTSDSDLSLERAMRSVSGGKFAWVPQLSPVVRDPLRFDQIATSNAALRALRDDDASGFQRENGFPLDAYDIDGDGVDASDIYVRSRVLKQIDRTVRFNRYDTNGDGRVDSSELVILRFGADPGIGGQMGGSGGYWLDGTYTPLGPVRLDGVDVETSVLLVAKNTTLAGLLHEMLHTWGGVDVYGPCFGCHNQNATIMAAMRGDDGLMQLDPWHRARFGWSQPVFVPISDAMRQAGGIRAFAAQGAGSVEMQRPLAFYDPAKGLSEYFLVEFRTPFPTCSGSSLPNNACPGNIDGSVADMGFAVWHVMTDTNNQILSVNRSNDPTGRFRWSPDDPPEANTRGLGVIDPTTGLIGTPRFLRPGDGEMALRWMDGTDTGLRLQSGPTARTSSGALLRWRDVATPAAYRLDRLRVPGFLTEEYPSIAAGSALAVDGSFDLSPGADVALIGTDGSIRPATMTSWAPSRAIVTIPATTPAGRYELVVAPGGATGDASRRSNGLHLQVPLPQLNRPVLTVAASQLGPLTIGGLRLDNVNLTISPPSGPDVPEGALPGASGAVPTDVYMDLTRQRSTRLLQIDPKLLQRVPIQPRIQTRPPIRPGQRKD